MRGDLGEAGGRRSVDDVDRVGDQPPHADGPVPLQEEVAQAAEVGPRHPAQVEHQDAGGLLGVPSQVRRHVPTGEQLGRGVADGEDPRLVARDGPQAAEQRHESRDRLAVAGREGVPEHVGEVVLVAHEQVHERDLVVGDDEVLAALGQVARPPPLRLSGGLLLAAVRQAGGGVLADRLQRPEARGAAVLGDHQQGLLDERVDQVGAVGAQHRHGRRPVEPVLEDREPRQRPLLVGAQQVPGPGDDRLQRAVAVGGGAVAAAQGGEPVVERSGHLRDRHRPDARGSELDGEGQPVEPVDDVAHRGGIEHGVRPRRRGALHEQLPGVDRGELAQRDRALGRQPQRRPAGGQHLQVAGRREQEGHQRGHRLEDVLAVVEDQQGRPRVELLRQPAAYVGLLGRGEREPGRHRAPDAEGRADRDHDVVARARRRRARPRARGAASTRAPAPGRCWSCRCLRDRAP